MKAHAGFAIADITPAANLPMGGYAARNGEATGTLDRLRCRAAVLSTGGPPVALVALDLLHVAGPWASTVRARAASHLGTEPSHVLLAATHTHSGPAVFGSAPGVVISAYEDELADIVLDTIRAAHAKMELCSLSAGEAIVDGVGASRRHEGEPIDDAARVLVARRQVGSVLGAVAAYGCHPTVLSPANRLYSRDLFGAAVDGAAAALGAPVLLFNGAAADVSTRFTRREASAGETLRLGGDLGARIALAAQQATRLDEGEASAETRRVAVRLRPLPAEAEAEERLAAAAAAVEQAREHGAPAGELRLALSRLEGAAAQRHFVGHGGWPAILGRVPEDAEVQVIRLGSVRLIAAPGEVFSATGRRLCARGGRLLIGYVNDYLGYLVAPERAGDGEYEALMAMLAPASAAAVERELEELLDG